MFVRASHQLIVTLVSNGMTFLNSFRDSLIRWAVGRSSSCSRGGNCFRKFTIAETMAGDSSSSSATICNNLSPRESLSCSLGVFTGVSFEKHQENFPFSRMWPDAMLFVGRVDHHVSVMDVTVIGISVEKLTAAEATWWRK